MKRGAIRITTVSILIALSVVFGKMLSITTGPLRFSFENLPILLSSILFGPLVGAITGGLSDIIGCVLVGYTINPIITLGSISIGVISGYIYKHHGGILSSVVIAHIIGSLIIKSIGLYLYYSYPIHLILLRIPTYLIVATLEYAIIRKIHPIIIKQLHYKNCS